MRYFYKKKDLFNLINTPKTYPISQIYAALTQIITDNTEYISDIYGRTGYLVNIGDYYLFQPSELNFKNISIYDRSTPIDYKHEMIQFEMQNMAVKPVIDKRLVNEKVLGNFAGVEEFERGKEILLSMFSNFILATGTKTIEGGNKNWYELCGIVMRKMIEDEGFDKNTLVKFVIEHIVDTLMLPDKIDLMNFMWGNANFFTIIPDANFKFFAKNVYKYLDSKVIPSYKGLGAAIVIYDGPSSINSLQIFVLNGKEWLPAEPEDKRTLSSKIDERYRIKAKDKLNAYVGFIGFENAKKYMVYKLKDTTNERSNGYRCDQAAKDKIIDVLNEIEGDNRFPYKETKDSALELCVRQELTLRNKQAKNEEGKIWFLNTEKAIYNEFEKKDKDKK